jgi:chorismate synthase
MAITGHKTLAVFLRYRIVDVRNSARALARTQAHRAEKAAKLLDSPAVNIR